jgi:DNA-binding MarR family transcriptional regulator
MEDESAWVEVVVPNPPKLGLRRGTMFKTKAQADRLLAYLKSPPPDFDGSNKKLAEHLLVSTRTIVRLMKMLQADGKILVQTKRFKLPFGWFVRRTIQLRKEI